MMNIGTRLVMSVGAASLLFLVNCTAEPGDDADLGDAPEVSANGLAERVTFQGWDQTVAAPTFQCGSMTATGKATFKRLTSESASTRGGGYCVLETLVAPINASCSKDADCGTPPANDYYYCLKPSGSSSKFCYHKAAGETAEPCQIGPIGPLSVGQSTTLTSAPIAIINSGFKYVTLSALNLPGETYCKDESLVPGTNLRHAEHPSYCSRVTSLEKPVPLACQ